MKKLVLSLLLAIAMLGMFAASASATAPSFNEQITATDVEPTNWNVNDTGVGADTDNNFSEVINAVDGHKTHGDYQQNTNSCASCHQTHTAKTGSKLLFADNTFKTCVACHDGTLGFYNVLTTGENTSIDGAGTFGGSHANNMSMHMANNTIKINAAPGGNKGNTDTASGKTTWGATFTCASCHTPHGSYSDRLLHYNPNGFATAPQVTVGSKTFGTYLQNLTVATSGTGTYLKLAESTDDVSDAPGTKALKVELYNGSSKIVSPWSYGYASHTGPHFTRLYTTSDTTGNQIWYGSHDEDIYVNLKEGYMKALTTAGNTLLSSAKGGHISRPYIVKMDLVETQDIAGLKIYKTNQAGYWNGVSIASLDPAKKAEWEAVGYKEGTGPSAGSMVGLGVQMSSYCATCHTDYFGSRSASGNTYFEGGTAAQRHSTNSDRFSCVRCHFAHGTDAEIMIDANGNTVASLTADLGGDAAAKTTALDIMTDKNPSSALKKYTNMSVCWACHGSSSRATSFKNDERRADAPHDMPYVNGDTKLPTDGATGTQR